MSSFFGVLKKIARGDWRDFTEQFQLDLNSSSHKDERNYYFIIIINHTIASNHWLLNCHAIDSGGRERQGCWPRRNFLDESDRLHNDLSQLGLQKGLLQNLIHQGVWNSMRKKVKWKGSWSIFSFAGGWSWSLREEPEKTFQLISHVKTEIIHIVRK